VSVVVPTRAGESVDLTMSSLMRQTCQDFEVRVVVDKDGRGAPWARNRGADGARGEYLLFSDSDIDWQPHALATMVSALEADLREQSALIAAGTPPDFLTAYAYGGYYITAPPGAQFDPGPAKSAEGFDLSHTTRSIGPLGNEPWDYKTLLSRNFVSTMSLMIRQAFTGFDEEILRLQDWDLWVRMAMKFRLRGKWVGGTLFTTPYREAGITFDGRVSYEEAWRAVRMKNGLPVPRKF